MVTDEINEESSENVRVKCEETDESLPIEQRDADLYFSDGSVVLSAVDAQTTTYFRVHKSVLSTNSPFFADLFSMALPSPSDTYDDTPLIQMHDDPDQLKQFLNALYYPCSLPFIRFHPSTIDNAEGPLILATKYQVDTLRKRIVEQLEYDWPNKLCAWDNAQDEIDSNAWTRPSKPDALRAIYLARVCDVPSILPAAFYDLSRTRIPLAESSALAARYELLLTWQDLNALACGKERILDFISSLRHADIECTDCQEFTARDYWAAEIIMKTITTRDPLAVLKEGIVQSRARKSYYSNTLCGICRDKLAEEMTQVRKSLWRQVPQWFGLA